MKITSQKGLYRITDAEIKQPTREPMKCDWHIGNPLHFLWVKWKQCPSSGCGVLLQSAINYGGKEIGFTQWRKLDVPIQCLTFSPSRWKIKTIISGPALDDNHISLIDKSIRTLLTEQQCRSIWKKLNGQHQMERVKAFCWETQKGGEIS